VNVEAELLGVGGIPGPPLYGAPGAKPPTSIPPAGQTSVTQGQNAVTGRFEIYRNGYRIAVAKTAVHAAEIAAHAATNWPNTYQPPIVTSFEAPAGM
jgi:hypothetical protein